MFKEKKSTKIIIILLLLMGSSFLMCFGYLQANGIDITSGESEILVLCADPGEIKGGVGGIDAIIILKIKNWQIDSVKPIFPGHVYHPTAKPPQDLKNHLIRHKINPDHYYLHDCFWEGDRQKGAKLAMETLEYNPQIKTDFVIIIKPQAVDAIIGAVGPVYVPGQGYVYGNSIELLRDEEDNQNISRRKSVKSLLDGIMTESKDGSNYLSLIYTIAVEIIKENIIIVI